jgi:hypothetical protein
MQGTKEEWGGLHLHCRLLAPPSFLICNDQFFPCIQLGFWHSTLGLPTPLAYSCCNMKGWQKQNEFIDPLDSLTTIVHTYSNHTLILHISHYSVMKNNLPSAGSESVEPKWIHLQTIIHIQCLNDSLLFWKGVPTRLFCVHNWNGGYLNFKWFHTNHFWHSVEQNF